MKRIIINKAQIKCLNEVNIAITAANNSLPDFSKAVNNSNTRNDIQKAKVADGEVNLTVSGPKSNDDQPTQAVNVAQGQTIVDAIGNQADDSLIRNGGRVSITGDGLDESLIFNKKTIEEARLSNIRKNGVILTKKQLRKSVF